MHNIANYNKEFKQIKTVGKNLKKEKNQKENLAYERCITELQLHEDSQ